MLRRYWMGGLGGLLAVTAGVHLLSAATACNEPVATSYGNPNTLDRKNLPGEGGAEPLICSGDAAPGGFDGGDCPSFASDIYPYLTAEGKWRCADGTCHGGASAPPIAGDAPGACLESLKAISVAGRPYVPAAGGDDPNASSILCNLQGACGSRMPKAPGADPTSAELCVIEAWLKCGSPP